MEKKIDELSERALKEYNDFVEYAGEIGEFDFTEITDKLFREAIAFGHSRMSQSNEKEVAEAFRTGKNVGMEFMKQKSIEKVNSMKKILWNDDIDISKHVENINRHNALDEVLSALNDL